MVYWKRKIRQPGGKKEKRKHENEIWHHGLWFPRQYRGRCVEEGPAGRLRAGGRHQPHLRFGREDGGKRGLCGLRGRGCSAGAGAGVHRGSRFGGSGARNGRSGAAPGREPRGACPSVHSPTSRFYEEVKQAAREGGAKVHLASGAIGGFDVLQTVTLMAAGPEAGRDRPASRLTPVRRASATPPSGPTIC